MRYISRYFRRSTKFIMGEFFSIKNWSIMIENFKSVRKNGNPRNSDPKSYAFKSAMFEVYKSLNRIKGNQGKNHQIHIPTQFRSKFFSKLTPYFYICIKLKNSHKNKVNSKKKSLWVIDIFISLDKVSHSAFMSKKPKYRKMVSNQDRSSKIIFFRFFRWSITGFGQPMVFNRRFFRFCSRKTV